MPSENQPAALHPAKNDSATGTNEDGNAAHTENSTVANELTRIADELHRLNRNLSVARHDGMEVVGLARLIAEMGNGRVVRR